MREPCDFNIQAGGGKAPCPDPARWLYVNGNFRRRECDHHAARTRQLIRYPKDIRLIPLDQAARTTPADQGDET